MKAKNFELFMGHFGNGISVSNKAEMENGDYKHIAHISESGNITLYVTEDYIPAEAMQKIKDAAKANREKYLQNWNMYSNWSKYEKLLGLMSLSELNEYLCSDFFQNKKTTLDDEVVYLEKKYIYNEGRY